ncbi:MAG: hypothetical protein AAB074_12605 [Planctomycetota bacterium]
MNTMPTMIAAMIAAALAFLAPAGVMAEPEKPPADKEVAETPGNAWTQFQKAVEAKDRERIWALLSKDSRALLETELGAKLKSAEGDSRKQLAEEIGVTVEEFAKMSEKDLVLAMVIASATKDKDSILKMKVTDIKIDGDKAEGKRDEKGEGKEEDMGPAYFLKEDGEWKLDMKREMEENESEEPDEEIK